MKVNFNRVARTITGFSTPVFGISWNPPESERETVRKLITFLEDRRALFNPYDIENPHWLIESVLEIRKTLTESLQALAEESGIASHLRALRAACRKFLDQTEMIERGRAPYSNIFAALGEMRGVFGIHIAQLCVKYGVDVEDELAAIFPVEDK